MKQRSYKEPVARLISAVFRLQVDGREPSSSTMIDAGRTIPSRALSRPEEELSALPIWAFTLGIFGLLTFGLTAVPSIICGHLALARTRSSGPRLISEISCAGRPGDRLCKCGPSRNVDRRPVATSFPIVGLVELTGVCKRENQRPRFLGGKIDGPGRIAPLEAHHHSHHAGHLRTRFGRMPRRLLVEIRAADQLPELTGLQLNDVCASRLSPSRSPAPESRRPSWNPAQKTKRRFRETRNLSPNSMKPAPSAPRLPFRD